MEIEGYMSVLSLVPSISIPHDLSNDESFCYRLLGNTCHNLRSTGRSWMLRMLEKSILARLLHSSDFQACQTKLWGRSGISQILMEMDSWTELGSLWPASLWHSAKPTERLQLKVFWMMTVMLLSLETKQLPEQKLLLLQKELLPLA